MSTPRKQKVLVAGCELDFVASAKAALEAHYTVSVASSKKEALEKAKRGSPHLVVIGFLEPRGDSFKLHEELREAPATSDISLLVVDVRPQDHTRKGWRTYEGVRMNAEGYLTQPVDPDELREEVARVVLGAAAERVDSKEVLEQIDLVLRRVERIEKALGSHVLDDTARGSAVGHRVQQATR